MNTFTIHDQEQLPLGQHHATSGGHTAHTTETEGMRMHPEDVPVFVDFSTSVGSVQLTLSGLAPRAQYTVGLEMSKYVATFDPRPVFQSFQMISVPQIGHCEPLGTRTLDSSCILPRNKTDTASHAQQNGTAARLMSNGEVILRYDLPIHDEEPHQFTVLVTDTFHNALVTYANLPVLLQ